MSENQLFNAFKMSQLLALKQQAELNAQESEDLELWLVESEANRELYNRLHDKALHAEDISLLKDFDVQAARNEAWDILGLSKPKILFHSFSRMAGIAAAVAGVMFGLYFFMGPDKFRKQVKNELAMDIKPGKNKAMLTIGDKTFQLSDGSKGVIVDDEGITYADGTSVTKEATQSLTISTPRGGTYQVSLPDGSKVWLNSASSLNYTLTLNNKRGIRKVGLMGEAYFEVKKDIMRPFVVESGGQQLTVLGTHFNVNAYSNESEIRTTLLEGSVQILSKLNAKSRVVVLKPNQQALLSDKNGISVKEVDANEFVAWKNGDFEFNEEKISSIVKKLERWYDVDIVLSESTANREFTGKISRSRNISNVLGMIEKTANVKFKIEGRRITAIDQ